MTWARKTFIALKKNNFALFLNSNCSTMEWLISDYTIKVDVFSNKQMLRMEKIFQIEIEIEKKKISFASHQMNEVNNTNLRWKERYQPMLAAQRTWIGFLFLDSMLVAPFFLFCFHHVFHLLIVAFQQIINQWPLQMKKISKIHTRKMSF